MDGLKTTLMMSLVLTGLLAGYVCADTESKFDMEPLRDPFWPVGYFPDDWQSEQADDPTAAAQVDSDWSVPESKIQVKATSRMGDRTAAIINDQIKEEGDVIEMIHNNRIYKWKLRKVNSNGTISLDRMEVANRTLGLPGDKK